MHIFGRTSTQTWADELLSVISRMADPTNVLITIFNLLLLRHNVQYNANSLLFTTLSSHFLFRSAKMIDRTSTITIDVVAVAGENYHMDNLPDG